MTLKLQKLRVEVADKDELLARMMESVQRVGKIWKDLNFKSTKC